MSIVLDVARPAKPPLNPLGSCGDCFKKSGRDPRLKGRVRGFARTVPL